MAKNNDHLSLHYFLIVYPECSDWIRCLQKVTLLRNAEGHCEISQEFTNESSQTGMHVRMWLDMKCILMFQAIPLFNNDAWNESSFTIIWCPLH